MNHTELPGDFGNLAMIILLMGMRHGLDADHLAAIDGLVRYNAQSRPRLARAAGVLFALGHGLVLAGFAVGMSTLARVWSAPQWLEPLGAWCVRQSARAKKRCCQECECAQCTGQPDIGPPRSFGACGARPAVQNVC